MLAHPVIEPPVGLIAGGGRLPLHVARGILQTGRRVACVGLAGQYDAQLPALCDAFAPAGVIRVGRWIKLLRRWGVREAIMVGTVAKATMYDPMLLLRYAPDATAVRLWYGVTRHDRRSDALLGALCDELELARIHMLDSTGYIRDTLADEGVMTRTQPTAAQRADIDFALPIIYRMGDLDIGQSIAVKDREIIAVEAIEGTDAMIRRAGELCRIGGWTLVKVPKPQQDKRFDVPTLGLDTVRHLKAAGGTCVAVEVGQVILLDKPKVLAEADRAGIALIGVRRPVG